MTFRPHQGIWPALLTPVTAQGEIRHDLLAAHAKQLLGLGCAGLTLFGTTGEGPSFSVDERQDALVARNDFVGRNSGGQKNRHVVLVVAPYQGHERVVERTLK